MSEDDCPGTNEAMQGLWKENSDLVGFISLTLILFCTTNHMHLGSSSASATLSQTLMEITYAT